MFSQACVIPSVHREGGLHPGGLHQEGGSADPPSDTTGYGQ